MNRVEIDGFTVQGLCVRTSNLDEAQGALPQAVTQAWGRIWHYFSDPQCPHRRAYTTDFERYRADGRIDICIAVEAS